MTESTQSTETWRLFLFYWNNLVAGRVAWCLRFLMLLLTPRPKAIWRRVASFQLTRLHFHITVHHLKKSGQELKGRTRRQELKQKGSVVTGLLLFLACSASFLIQLRTWLLGCDTIHGGPGASSTVNQENTPPPRFACRPSLWRHFLS